MKEGSDMNKRKGMKDGQKDSRVGGEGRRAV